MIVIISDYITIISDYINIYVLYVLCLLYQCLWIFLVSSYLCTQTTSVCIDYAPRKACSRTIDDDILARPVKDTDLLLLGSAHPVPADDCFRRWTFMPWRVSNSLEQWRHLNPTAWVMLCCPPGRITHETVSRLQCPGIWFLGELAKIDDRWCTEETCSKKLRINDKQRVCSVLRMILRALSLANLCKWYRRNLQP